jgi:hypothetical protein
LGGALFRSILPYARRGTKKITEKAVGMQYFSFFCI